MLGIQAARSLCPLIAAAATAATTASAAIATDCDRPDFMTRADIPGLGMADIRADKIELSVFGYAEAPEKCVTTNTVFEAASLTKPVVAYIALRLVDQERFQLDDALIDLLPTLPLPEDDPRRSEVTIRMALAHSTGLEGPDDATLRFIENPGATFRYYPAGYRLVQRVIEHLEGESLEAVAERELFEPLGMSSTSLVFREDLLDRIASRHRMLGEPIQRERNPEAPPNAAASLITTPGDYALFLRNILAGEGLSVRLRSEMLTPVITVPETGGAVAWGLGWGLEPDRGTFFHYGDDGAAKSFVIGSTQADAATVYFANSFYGMAIAGEIAEKVVSGASPAVEWLGYSTWDDPERLARHDVLRAFVEADADQGMAKFLGYEQDYPDLNLADTAAFLQWILEGRSLHEGRTRVIAWQIENEPDNADHYLNLARSQRVLGKLQPAVDTLGKALVLVGDDTKSWIEAQRSWINDEILAAERDSDAPVVRAARISGTYGSWTVFERDGTPAFQVGEGDPYTLRWMHGTTYALEELDWFRLRFVLEGDAVTKVTGRYSDGRTTDANRSDQAE